MSAGMGRLHSERNSILDEYLTFQVELEHRSQGTFCIRKMETLDRSF
jgi:hypothetical protein